MQSFQRARAKWLVTRDSAVGEKVNFGGLSVNPELENGAKGKNRIVTRYDHSLLTGILTILPGNNRLIM